METQFKDVYGKEVQEGDFVIYATTAGRSPDLKIGLVIGVKPAVPAKGYHEAKPSKLRVRSLSLRFDIVDTQPVTVTTKSYSWQNNVYTEGTLAIPGNIIKQNPEMVPEAIKEFLTASKS